jgi:hypothetical protein
MIAHTANKHLMVHHIMQQDYTIGGCGCSHHTDFPFSFSSCTPRNTHSHKYMHITSNTMQAAMVADPLHCSQAEMMLQGGQQSEQSSVKNASGISSSRGCMLLVRHVQPGFTRMAPGESSSARPAGLTTTTSFVRCARKPQWHNHNMTSREHSASSAWGS